MIRGISRLIVRSGFLLVPLWIAAAVGAVHWLPDVTDTAGSSLGGLVPADARAVAAQEREVKVFGNTLLTQVVVVQHSDEPLIEIVVAGDRLGPAVVAFECGRTLNPSRSARP